MSSQNFSKSAFFCFEVKNIPVKTTSSIVLINCENRKCSKLPKMVSSHLLWTAISKKYWLYFSFKQNNKFQKKAMKTKPKCQVSNQQNVNNFVQALRFFCNQFIVLWVLNSKLLNTVYCEIHFWTTNNNMNCFASLNEKCSNTIQL